MKDSQIATPKIRRQYVKQWRANKIKSDPSFIKRRNAWQRAHRKKIKECNPEYHARLKQGHLEWLHKNKEHSVKYRKERYKNPSVKNKYKAYALKRNHGISLEEWQEKLESQCGECAICGKNAGFKAAVDHDHATGQIRDILCTKCNLMLGFFEKYPEKVPVILAYIKRWTDFQFLKQASA